MHKLNVGDNLFKFTMTKTSSPCATSCSYLSFILLTVFIPTCFCSPWLHLGASGYKSLVVAIHPSVPEQKQFVDKLQNLLLSTSSALHRVMSKMFFFEEVVIILPVTWTKEFHDVPKTRDVFSKADVRVYGSGGPPLPYCIQYDNCEKQGRYIQFTAQFVESYDNSSGELLMQEFARYRYGIFSNLNLKENLDVPLIVTSQGFRCDMQNSRDVFDNHPDLQNYREIALHDPNEHHHQKYEPSPVFKLFKTTHFDTYMLVFDTSRALWENPISPNTVANLTLKRLVREFLPDNSQVGFITFSNTVNIMRGLTQLSTNVKDSFFQGLHMEFSGSKQALANAIAKATEMLSKNHHGSKILIVSDGNNDVAPPLENVTPALADNMISVSVLSPKIRHEANLNFITTATGGSVYFLSSDWILSTETHTSMLDHFSESASNGDIQIISEGIIISRNMTYSFNVSIDHFLGKRTKFEFFGEQLENSGIQIFISSSSNVVYNLKNATHRQSFITFRVNDETGNWTILFVNPARHFVHIHVRVTSRPLRQDLKVPTLESWIDVERTVYYSIVRIFADLHEGPYGITDANISAIVRTPNGNDVTILLRDTGNGADITADDGVYSAYFTKFDGDGAYTVLTRAESTNRTRTCGRERYTHNSQHGKNNYLTNYMTRSKYGGSFTIHNYQSSMNKIPPGQVTDFKAYDNDEEPPTITLEWTAPGSDFDTGTVSLYDLRMGFNIEDENEISEIFHTWYSITTANLIKGILDPLLSGSKQVISVSIPQLSEKMNGGKIYFALRSQDINGNPSKISNVAMVKLQKDHQELTSSLDKSMRSSSFEVADTISDMTDATVVISESDSGVLLGSTTNNFHIELDNSERSSATPTSQSPVNILATETSSTVEKTVNKSELQAYSNDITSTPYSFSNTGTEVMQQYYEQESQNMSSPHTKNVITSGAPVSVNISDIQAFSNNITSTPHSFSNTGTEVTTSISFTKQQYYKQETKSTSPHTENIITSGAPMSVNTTKSILEHTTNVIETFFKTLAVNISDTHEFKTDTPVVPLVDLQKQYEQNVSTENKTDNEIVSANISHNQIAIGAPVMQKEKSFSETNVSTSTVVAAWVGGFCLTFFVIAGIAMMVRSWQKRGKYDVGKREENSTNSVTEELICNDSTVTIEDSF